MVHRDRQPDCANGNSLEAMRIAQRKKNASAMKPEGKTPDDEAPSSAL